MESRDPLARQHACEVGDNLRRLRKEQKLTQGRLAEMVGTKHPRISDIEYGLVDLSLSELCELARALDVVPSDLVDLGAYHPREFPPASDGHAPL